MGKTRHFSGLSTFLFAPHRPGTARSAEWSGSGKPVLERCERLRSMLRTPQSRASYCHPCQSASAGGSQGTAISWERSYSGRVRNLLGLMESQRADRGNRGFRLLRQVHCPTPARAATRGDHTYEFAAASQSVWRTIEAFPYNFSEPHELENSLRGIDALINTYWVRFDNPPHFTFAQSLANSKVLFDAAKRMGVGRVVHISITNPDRKSHLRYFRGKVVDIDWLQPISSVAIDAEHGQMP